MNYISFLFICLSFSALAQEKVIVYDEMVEERKLPRFTELQVEGGIDVYISMDNKQTVAVSARQASFRDLIQTEVVGDRLKISGGKYRGKGTGDMHLKIYLAVPSLEKIIASGASDVFVNGILQGKQLTVQLIGASDFSGAVHVEKLQLTQTGSSDAKLSGSVGQLNSILSGASDLKAFDCSVEELNAQLTGASQLEITVNKEMNITASGASDVRYKGKGVMKKVSSDGASTVRIAD